MPVCPQDPPVNWRELAPIWVCSHPMPKVDTPVVKVYRVKPQRGMRSRPMKVAR